MREKSRDEKRRNMCIMEGQLSEYFMDKALWLDE